ncbi:hypothetical protein DSECCO2_651020 [anaerobic digester metagenome]
MHFSEEGEDDAELLFGEDFGAFGVSQPAGEGIPFHPAEANFIAIFGQKLDAGKFAQFLLCQPLIEANTRPVLSVYHTVFFPRSAELSGLQLEKCLIGVFMRDALCVGDRNGKSLCREQHD